MFPQDRMSLLLYGLLGQEDFHFPLLSVSRGKLEIFSEVGYFFFKDTTNHSLAMFAVTSNNLKNEGLLHLECN